MMWLLKPRGASTQRNINSPDQHEKQKKRPHLVLYSFAVFGVAHNSQLQLRHLLHLAVHVDLLQQAADLAAQQTHRVFFALPLRQQRGAGRVDGRHPVFQVSLVGGLKRRRDKTLAFYPLDCRRIAVM